MKIRIVLWLLLAVCLPVALHAQGAFAGAAGAVGEQLKEENKLRSEQRHEENILKEQMRADAHFAIVRMLRERCEGAKLPFDLLVRCEQAVINLLQIPANKSSDRDFSKATDQVQAILSENRQRAASAQAAPVQATPTEAAPPQAEALRNIRMHWGLWVMLVESCPRLPATMISQCNQIAQGILQRDPSSFDREQQKYALKQIETVAEWLGYLAATPKTARSFVPDAPACTPAIESTIAGEFQGWDGETIFKLDNGQIWQQAEYDYMYSYSYRPEVTIYQTSSGCRMKVEDEEETVLVRRIK